HRHLHPFPTRRSSDLLQHPSAYYHIQKHLYGRQQHKKTQFCKNIGRIAEVQKGLPLEDFSVFDNLTRTIHDSDKQSHYNTHKGRSEEHTSELQSRENL